MRNMFYCIRLTMRKIIHRVNAPFVICSVVSRMFDAIHDRVSHVHIGCAHIYLGTQYFFAVFELAMLHLFK